MAKAPKGFVKSKGHVGIFGAWEYYKDARGELWRAPLDNVIDVTNGYRIGRWEAPAHMAETFLAQARKFSEARGVRTTGTKAQRRKSQRKARFEGRAGRGTGRNSWTGGGG